jgi:membrane-anchored protein YejM (alkaline phosphatase superfamily)
MQNNFAGGEYHDTIYITANPFADRLDDGTFYYVDFLTDEWNDEIGTIFPEDVRAAAVEANREHPNKRLIVHFMQPHRPYLGEMAEELRGRVDLKGYRNEGEGVQIWGAAKQKDVTVEEVRRAYGESLDIVLAEVEELLDELDGKTVVTADHGEMLGERVFPFTTRVWGHSEGFNTRCLRTVPWLTVEGDERREITAEAPEESADLENETVSDRLEALGYAE